MITDDRGTGRYDLPKAALGLERREACGSDYKCVTLTLMSEALELGLGTLALASATLHVHSSIGLGGRPVQGSPAYTSRILATAVSRDLPCRPPQILGRPRPCGRNGTESPARLP